MTRTDTLTIPGGTLTPSAQSEHWVACLTEVTEAFTRWYESAIPADRLWPAFDQFVRETLLDAVGATRVRLYRVVEGGRALRPLVTEAGVQTGLTMPTGLIGHVLHTGRNYIRGDWRNGSMIDALARESETASCSTQADGGEAAAARNDYVGYGSPVWAFTVRTRSLHPGRDSEQGAWHPIGLITVGELVSPREVPNDVLDMLARLISLFWQHVRNYDCLQLAWRTDRGSGVYNRTDFLDVAGAIVAEAQKDGEPLVVMSVAMEGLRGLDDSGQWTVRDELIRETGQILRRKIRSDDVVGRFGDDRFVALLRWLDLPLSRLIASKVIQSVQEVVTQSIGKIVSGKNDLRVVVRCGLSSNRDAGFVSKAGSVVDGASLLNDLLVGAFAASASARRNHQEICTAEDALGNEESTPGSTVGDRA